MNYTEFLQSKQVKAHVQGITVDASKLHPSLFPFQRDATLWALRKGRSLLGIDTGLGKTRCQLEWARLLIESGKAKRVLIVAPLSVGRQTIREATLIGIEVRYVTSENEMQDGISITNYERIEQFTGDTFQGIVADEASIFKAIAGVIRQYMTKHFAKVPYRLNCTATPAPNDEAEIGMQSEYLGINTHNEMLSMFFINANKVIEDVMTTQDGRSVKTRTKLSNKLGQEWRLRNYGKEKFYQWLSSWGLMMSLPSDLGYDDDGYVLPPLNIEPVFIDVNYVPENQLFFTKLKGIQDRTNVRRSTLAARVGMTSKLINASKDQWIVWCGLDQESKALKEAIPDGIEVKGQDTPEYKAEMLEAFQDGKFRVLISKPKIAGFGMNFQNSHHMAFVGLGDSWESYYQCIRREWRFGQKHPVKVHIVLSEVEREIYENVMRKERMANEMKRELIKNIHLYEEEELGIGREIIRRDYVPTQSIQVPTWL